MYIITLDVLPYNNKVDFIIGQSATVEKFSKRLNQTSLLVMDQVTKNAPFGTDNTPKIEYKIVAGKRVEILAKVDSTKGFNKR